MHVVYRVSSADGYVVLEMVIEEYNNIPDLETRETEIERL